jgi:sugar phosphate isomerase/epimerase
MERRDFLKTAMWAAGGGIAGRATARGAAAGRKLERIGLQLYTVRDVLETDFEGTLRQVAAIGFHEVEFAGFFGVPPGKVRELLERYRLAAPSAHVNTKEIRGEWSKSLDEAREIGLRYLICAWLEPEERPRLDDYRRIAALLNQAGEACRKSGLGFGYHNHDFEFAPLSGKVPYRTLLEETDPALVKMELDLYWITKGNQDPLEYLGQYPGRFLFVHVKDMDRTPARGFADVGQGIIDFKKIFGHAAPAGVKHFFVENDEPRGSSIESARVSFEYLKALEF